MLDTKLGYEMVLKYFILIQYFILINKQNYFIPTLLPLLNFPCAFEKKLYSLQPRYKVH